MDTNLVMAIPLLVKGLSDPDRVIGRRAAAALGALRMPPELVVAALTNSLRHSDPVLRIVVLDSIASFGTNGAKAIPSLQWKLNDPDKSVREAATNALRKVKGQLTEGAVTG